MATEQTRISNSLPGDIELNFLRKPLDALVLVVAVPIARLAEPLAVAFQDQALLWVGSESGILFTQLLLVITLQVASLRYFDVLDKPWRQLKWEDSQLFGKALLIPMVALLGISAMAGRLAPLMDSAVIGWLAIPYHEILVATAFVLVGLLAPRMARRVNYLLGPRVRRARRRQIRQLRDELLDAIRILELDKKRLEAEKADLEESTARLRSEKGSIEGWAIELESTKGELEEAKAELEEAKADLEHDRERLLYNVAHLRELGQAREAELRQLKGLLLEQGRQLDHLCQTQERSSNQLEHLETLSTAQTVLFEKVTEDLLRKSDLEGRTFEPEEKARGVGRDEEPLWLMIDKLGTTHLVPVSEVHWFQAERSETRVMTIHGERRWRQPIKNLGEKLGCSFVRLNRGVLVRGDQIERLEFDEDAHPMAVLVDGTVFRISSGRAPAVNRWLEERSIRTRSETRKHAGVGSDETDIDN